MATDPGALRHQLRRPEAGIASLAVPDANAQLDEIKSKVHYIWFPHVDINLFGAEGLRFKLGKGWSYYGMGLSGDDFGLPISVKTERTANIPRPETSKAAETREEYDARNADRLMRCTAYPCWNIYYKETKYNMGEFTATEERTGNDLGAEPPVRDRLKYAGVCVADFLGRYREDYGARVLTPFIGMDGNDQNTVAEIFRLVQPYAYPLTNLRQEAEGELTDEETLLFDLADRGPADERIRAAKLDKPLSQMAHEVRRICRSGVLAAVNTARVDWADLMEQLSNTAQGHKGHKKGPSPYDREIAWLLKQPVPATVIAQPQNDGELRTGLQRVSEAVTTLTNVVAQQQMTPQGGFDLDEAKEVLEALRAERKALEALRQSHTTESPAPAKGNGGKKTG